MKLWIYMLTLLISVLGLCLWDTIYTNKVFNNLIEKSNYISSELITKEISDENIQNEIYYLNDFWTEKMDILSISISRKDLQPVSDYLQYLCSSAENENQEDAVTYSKLLNYNIIGLKESSGFSLINLF